MSQKIIRIGSSLGVTLRADLLEKTGLSQGDEVLIEFNAKTNTIELRSAQADVLSQQLAEAQLIVSRYKDEIRKLNDQD